MSDTRLIWFTKLEVILFLGSLAAIITHRLLNGSINTRYLFYGKEKDGTRSFKPEKVQLLVFTLGAAAFYLIQVTNSLKTKTPVLPDVPTETLALLGGSHAIYLAGKAYTKLFKNITKGE